MGSESTRGLTPIVQHWDAYAYALPLDQLMDADELRAYMEEQYGEFEEEEPPEILQEIETCFIVGPLKTDEEIRAKYKLVRQKLLSMNIESIDLLDIAEDDGASDMPTVPDERAIVFTTAILQFSAADGVMFFGSPHSLEAYALKIIAKNCGYKVFDFGMIFPELADRIK